MDTRSIFKFVKISLAFIFIPPLFSAPPSPKVVAITQIVDHPSANAVREGILNALKAHGYMEGKNLKIIYKNAQGSPVTATQIAKTLVASKPDVLVPITTPSTQAVVKADESYAIPIVFAAVTDPVVSGVVSSLQHPGGHITGVTDAVPLEQQFTVFQQILPHMKILGLLYDPGDDSSTTAVKEMQKIAKKRGYTLVEAPVFKTSDIASTVHYLVGKKVDAVFVPLDNTVLSAMKTVLNITSKYKIPILTSDSDSVAQGALVSSGYSHFETGIAAGKLLIQVLQGANPGDIPVATAHDQNIYINLKSAKELNITIPEAVIKKAQKMEG